jgi:phosphatidylglycerol:prolipoprotein diacylglycerol transferase
VIDPIALQLGPISIHWYGIIMATAILAAAWFGSAEARRRGENADVGWSLLLWAIAGGVIGARLYHVIHQWDFYSANPSLIPQVWNGGLGIPGAVAGGAFAIWIATRVRHLPTARWFDIFVMALPLGQAIGRLGNFVNQELYGPPTTLPWGIPISAAHRVPEWANLNLYPRGHHSLPSASSRTRRCQPPHARRPDLDQRRFAARLYDGDMLLIYIMFYGRPLPPRDASAWRTG